MSDSPSDETADGASIRPVSHLRSQFENLNRPKDGHGHAASHKPRTPSAAFAASSVVRERVSLDAPRPAAFSQAPSSPVVSQSSSQAVQPSTIRHDIPSRSLQNHRSKIQPPPLVTVDSPKSPPKPEQSPALSPGFSRETSPHAQSRNIDSTASTPVMGNSDFPVRNVRRQLSGPLISLSDPSDSAQASTPTSSQPPPVNRAGKPKISKAPPVPVSSKPNNGMKLNLDQLPVLDPSAQDDQRLSPFNTPPSEVEESPEPVQTWIPTTAQHSSPRIAPPLSNTDRFQPPPVHVPIRQHQAAREQGLGIQDVSKTERPGRPLNQAPKDDPLDRPLLPPRHELQTRSARASPARISARRSDEGLHMRSKHQPISDLEMNKPRSSMTQSKPNSGVTSPARKRSPPAIPAPRRSMETRTATPSPVPEKRRPSRNEAEPTMAPQHTAPPAAPGEHPDPSTANRRPPRFQRRPWEISTGYDTRLCAVCGEHVCTSGFVTRVWNILTGENLLTLSHGENVKVTSLAWKPARDSNDEGKRLWLGTNGGDILEVDVAAKDVVDTRSYVHQRREIIRMYRYAAQLWTLDDDGNLNVWRPGADGAISLDSTFNTYKVQRGHTFSIAVGEQLWLATGKDIRVYKPGASSESGFQVLSRPLSQQTAGDVTCGATVSDKPDEIFFGHIDGKVSVYRRSDYSCIGTYSVGLYKINAMAGAGSYLWAGYSTGAICVYDTTCTPWRMVKDWRAHENPVAAIVTDHSSIWKVDRLQVITLGTDAMLRIWDGLLETDWVENETRQRDFDYCRFHEINAAVMTWNCGAAKPTYLRNDQKDNNFFREFLVANENADILVFGFQELIDLEDKKVTAKSFFKSKKKDPSEQEHIGHQYRAWRDHLVRCVDESMASGQTYTVLHTASMVGLFSCVFIKTSLRPRVSRVDLAEVKRGMGGHHGNKGALILRFILDDSSLCFVNCHLAAGQTQTINRNNDIAAILESEALGPASASEEVFVGGGDGAMAMDHEICIINGDLNYRIDAMTRDHVVRAVREGNLSKLLDRDQLLLSRKRNPGFKLRLFQELPIDFDPTYKYNVGTDEYDTSEKKRSPAWCDRILFRGMGKVKCADYRRWEVRVSDHRPVTCRFKLRIKTVDEDKRDIIHDKAAAAFGRYSDRMGREVKLEYLVNILGLSKREAQELLVG